MRIMACTLQKPASCFKAHYIFGSSGEESILYCEDYSKSGKCEFEKAMDIKDAPAEVHGRPSTNTGGSKLFLLQLQDVLNCKDCSDIEKLAGALALVKEYL